ncbi:RNA polymerase sigma factor [compost metagenome]
MHRVGARARAAFLMHRIHGMTHPAIAAELRVSERTVRNDIAQAMLCFLLDTDLQPDGLRCDKAGC